MSIAPVPLDVVVATLPDLPWIDTVTLVDGKKLEPVTCTCCPIGPCIGASVMLGVVFTVIVTEDMVL